MADAPRVEIAGSERTPLPEDQRVGPADPNERVAVTVMLRRRGPLPALPAGHLHPHQLEAAAGADPDELRKVEDFAHRSGLDVVDAHPGRRTVVLSGPVSALEKAFGTELWRYDLGGQVIRGRSGPLTLPADLAGAVEGVFGLDDRPSTRPHVRLLAEEPHDHGHVVLAHAPSVSYSPLDLAMLYQFPALGTGAGQCIALLEFGGGYSTDDLASYFHGLGLQAPAIVAVSVDGAHNQPEGKAAGPDAEVALDIEVAGAVAPGARIAVYFAPNTERGFLDAVSTAVHDQVRRPSVVSISWGGPEKSWTAQAITAIDTVFQDAAALGVTVLCASGDAGSGDGVSDGLAHADFPASSPHVTGCGGTRLSSASGDATDEVVWNNARGATGGGVSDSFGPADWQAHAQVPPSANPGGRRGRGVPDVSADADPETGYRMLVSGQETVGGGTSAVAPLWAGLVALLNEQLGHPIGFLNPSLYGPVLAAGGFRDIIAGSNGAYSAGPGWDACTGLGTPQGTAILEALLGTTVTGQPARRRAPAQAELEWHG
jgi:kumamolisin